MKTLLARLLAACHVPKRTEPPAPSLSFSYTNWRGETALRTVQPLAVVFGSTEWHPEPQWLLKAVDLEKAAVRDFAMKDMVPPVEAVTAGIGRSFAETITLEPRLKDWKPSKRGYGALLVDLLDQRDQAFNAGVEAAASTLDGSIQNLDARHEGTLRGLLEEAKDFILAEKVDVSIVEMEASAEAELSEVAAAIGSTRFMDHPDGGDVSLGEQVRRMRDALQRAEEENVWRQKATDEDGEAFAKILIALGGSFALSINGLFGGEARAAMVEDTLRRAELLPVQFQRRVKPWLEACFGPEIAIDKTERNHRFIEEALELVQSTGCTKSEAHQLVDYVFGREKGEPVQEVGGVMNTLAALCLAHDLDMHEAGEIELRRVWQPAMLEKIRAKQKAKPKHSPLPEAAE